MKRKTQKKELIRQVRFHFPGLRNEFWDSLNAGESKIVLGYESKRATEEEQKRYLKMLDACFREDYRTIFFSTRRAPNLVVADLSCTRGWGSSQHLVYINACGFLRNAIYNELMRLTV